MQATRIVLTTDQAIALKLAAKKFNTKGNKKLKLFSTEYKEILDKFIKAEDIEKTEKFESVLIMIIYFIADRGVKYGWTMKHWYDLTSIEESFKG